MVKSSKFTLAVKQGANLLTKTVQQIKKENEKSLPYLTDKK
jgi:hypothetical protein